LHITFLALHAGSADIYLMIHKSSIFFLLLRITFLISIWWYIKFESNKNYATQNLPKKYHMWLIKAQFLYSITFLLRWPKIFLHKLFLCILSHIYYILQCDYLPETISRSKLCNTKMVIEYVPYISDFWDRAVPKISAIYLPYIGSTYSELYSIKIAWYKNPFIWSRYRSINFLFEFFLILIVRGDKNPLTRIYN